MYLASYLPDTHLMSASSPSSSRPYVSRRKRRSSKQDMTSVSTKLTFGALGLLLLSLLVSLGVIATHLVTSDSPGVAENAPSIAPVPVQP